MLTRECNSNCAFFCDGARTSQDSFVPPTVKIGGNEHWFKVPIMFMVFPPAVDTLSVLSMIFPPAMDTVSVCSGHGFTTAVDTVSTQSMIFPPAVDTVSVCSVHGLLTSYGDCICLLSPEKRQQAGTNDVS